jgi:Protein of unknown function (DUF2946)
VRLRARIARLACALVLLQSLAPLVLNQVARSERSAGTVQIAICTPSGLRYVTLPGAAALPEQTPAPAKRDRAGPNCPICFGCHVATGLPQGGGDGLVAPATPARPPFRASAPRRAGVTVLAFAARAPPPQPD